MLAALAAHDGLRPRSDSRLGLGATLALLAHGGLLGALALGLNWRLPQATVSASAELWAAVPQAATPAAAAVPAPVPPPTPAPAPAPPPPPTPTPAPPRPAPPPPGPTAAEREAEIALEKAQARQREQQVQKARDAAERQRQRLADEQTKTRQREQQAKADKADKAEKTEKAEKARRQKAEAEQRERAQQEALAQAQDAQVARQREENLKRMLGQAGATGPATATGSAARDAAPSAAYAGRIKAFIKPNILLAVDVPGNPVTEIEVKLAPDGSVISRRIVKPSGNPGWDNIVLRAIDKTATLPRDTDGRVPASMLLVFPRQE